MSTQFPSYQPLASLLHDGSPIRVLSIHLLYVLEHMEIQVRVIRPQIVDDFVEFLR